MLLMLLFKKKKNVTDAKIIVDSFLGIPKLEVLGIPFCSLILVEAIIVLYARRFGGSYTFDYVQLQ